MDPRIASFRDALDARPLTSFQVRLVIMAFAMLVMDGYDVQAVGYVAPVLSELWSLERGAFGPVFGVGLVGLTIGSLVFAPISDRIGCRPVLIGCTLLYGASTLATALADSWWPFLALRFITGIGLGSAMPSTIALVSDYSPTRFRNLMVIVGLGGFAIGGALAGFVAALIIPRFGWSSVFVIGGTVPLLAIPFLMRWLPEALPRLLADPAPHSRLARVVSELVPGWVIPKLAQVGPESKKVRFPVAVLFDKAYVIQTMLFWIVFFCNILLVYFFVNWIPTIVRSAGQTLELANVASGAFQLSGIAGGLLLAYAADRTRRPQVVLCFAYVCGAIFCFLFGSVAGASAYAVIGSACSAGFFIVGGNGVLNVFAGNYYPAAIRATGVGWGIGVGRFGAILGPVVGGMLISLGVSMETLFSIFAVPALLAAICAISIKRSPDQAQSSDSIVVTGVAVPSPQPSR